MKKTPLVCVIMLVAGLGFADPLEMTHREIHIDSQNPSRTDTYINRSSDNMQLTDPIVGSAALNNWREKTTSTLVVDKNGRGDYTTIQGAIDAINDSAPTNPYVVYVMPGVYDEKVDIDKSYISLIGIDREKSIISRNVTDRYMTVKVYSTDGPISNINIANLTIKNTNSWGGGGQAAQEAISIGHPDEGANAVTDVRIENCYLYGYQDTTFVYPNSEAIFENCYIYGGFDIASVWKAKAKYFNCRLQIAHTSAAGIFYQYRSTVYVIDNWLESTQAGSRAIILHNNSDVLHFTGNYLAANLAANPIHFGSGVTPTVYVVGNNGYNYRTGITFLPSVVGNLSIGEGGALRNNEAEPSFEIYATADRSLKFYAGATERARLLTTGEFGLGTATPTHKLHVVGDVNATGSLYVGTGINVGTATGAAAGEIRSSGNIYASGQKVTANLFEIEDYTGGLPLPSIGYRGCLAFVQGDPGSEDKLYVCVKNADGSYDWDEIGQGTSESRVPFE